MWPMQLTKTMSVEFARRKQSVACIVLHPGTVDTDLSAPISEGAPGMPTCLSPASDPDAELGIGAA